MSATPVDAEVEPVTRVRPGHADLTGALKYGLDDVREVIERASSRETAARVAVGAVCAQLLAQFGVAIHSHVIATGGEGYPADAEPDVTQPDFWERVEASEMRCADADLTQRMIERILEGKRDGRHLRRRLRGDRHGRPRWPGQLQPVGPAAQRAYRAGADEHPLRQGRRDRRRLRAGGAARLAGPRCRALRWRAGWPGMVPPHQPCGRRRGRHQQRRAGRRAGGRQADSVAGAPAAVGGRTAPARTSSRRATSAAMSASSPPPGWWARRCWPSR